MNIFDPHISGSLSVSGSGEISGDLRVLGTINATISGTTSNAISASHAAEYTLTSSFHQFTSSYTTGSFTGSFIGDGAGLVNIPASGVTGLNLNKIISGSVSASISPDRGFEVNTNTTVSGHITPSVDNEYDLGSPTHQWRDVYISSGSLYIDGSKVLSSTTQELTITTDNGQSLKILEGTTDSIVLQTADGNVELKSSADGDILLDPTNGKILLKGPVEVLSGQKIQSSVGGTPVVFANDIVVSGSIDLTGTIDGIDLSSFSSSINNLILDIDGDISSLNSFTSSINTTIKSKLDSDGVVSGSSQIILSGTTGFSTVSASLSSLSSSISITNLNQDGRLNSIEGKTGSFATTGSNTFVGSQVISGSVTIRENLIVLGSSSITYTTSSQLRVDDNVIVVNTSSPAERFGGLQVFDSGSAIEATGSLLWDSEKNRWVYQQSSEASYGGGVLMSGPRSSGSLGDELTLTSGKIARSAGGDHLNDSIITEYNAATIGINGNLEITGSIISSVTPLVSGSSQISYTGLVNVPSGIVSGSSQITYSSISSIPSGIVSGSSQITYSSISSIPSGIVSGSSQISYPSLSNIPGGIVSGSIQVDLTATTNYSSGIKTRLNAEGVWSGSAQLPSGTVSGSVQIIAGLPSGTVSGSSQISLSSTSGFGSYLNQGVLTTSTPTFGSTIINGNITMNPGTGDLGARYLTINKGASNDGGILMSRDNAYDWQIINSTSSGDLSFYSYGIGANSLVISRSSGVITANNGFNVGNAKLRWGGTTTPTLGFPFTGGPNGFWIDVNDGDTGGIVIDNDGTTIYGAGDTGHVFRVVDEDVYQATSNVDSSTTFRIHQGQNGGGYVRGAFEVTGNLTVGGVINTATVNRDLYLNGGTGGNYGNRLIVGGTSTDYTLQDTNVRPTIYMTGAYPVLTLNHTQTSNTSHGPTIQFTHYTADKQWVIGTNGSGTQMDFGYSSNTNRNPHNGIDNYQGSTFLRITNSGNVIVTGTFTETSSLRYKTNIQTIESGLDKVLQMRGVVYKRKDNGKEEIGVIAEEMNEILPQVIQYNTESEIDSVSYSRIVGVLIEAIKELKQEINDLKNNG